jgi:energy-coupling factor transporter ATP-binding protein EcfA2
MDSSSDLAAALGSVAELLGRVDGLPPDLERQEERLVAQTRATEARVAAGGDDLLVVLVGPTGAGKSTLLNALTGRSVSPAGARRPTTAAPVVVASGGRAEGYRRRGVGGIQPADVVRVDGDLTEHLTLVDAPDPDSVERSHARALDALVTVADLVIVVTTPARYGDAIPWELLGRVQRLGSIGWVVMNRVRDEVEGRLQVGHLVARARAAGFDVAADQVVRLPERPGLGLVRSDLDDLAGVLVEVGRDDARYVKSHAHARAAAEVARAVRAWLDAVDAVAAGADRRARTAVATSVAERDTLAEDLATDQPGRGAHGAALLRLRAGAETEDVVGRLLDAVVADLDARFGIGPEVARDLVETSLGDAPADRRLAVLLGDAGPDDQPAFHRRLAEGLIDVVDVPVPVVPAGLAGAVDHLGRLVDGRVPA